MLGLVATIAASAIGIATASPPTPVSYSDEIESMGAPGALK